jgi:hypothetical protein
MAGVAPFRAGTTDLLRVITAVIKAVQTDTESHQK